MRRWFKFSETDDGQYDLEVDVEFPHGIRYTEKKEDAETTETAD